MHNLLEADVFKTITLFHFHVTYDLGEERGLEINHITIPVYTHNPLSKSFIFIH